MKVKYYFILVGLSIIAFIALMNYKPTPSVATSTPTKTGYEIQYGVKQYITVNKFSSVEISIFNNGRYDNVVIGTDDTNTTYVCHYNKGLAGEDRVVIPAYSDWNRLGFTPKLQKPDMKKVELSLPYSAPMKTAQVYYIFRRE